MVVRLRVNLDLEVQCPALEESGAFFQNDEDDKAVKEWIWKNRKGEILAAMKVTRTDNRRVLPEEQADHPSKDIRRRLDLLDKIGQVQRQYLMREEVCIVSPSSLGDAQIETSDNSR